MNISKSQISREDVMWITLAAKRVRVLGGHHTMLKRNFAPFAASLTLVVALMLSAVGCSDSGNTPRDSYTHGGVTLLYRGGPNAKPTDGESATIEDSVRVSTSDNVAIGVGNDEIGTSGLDIPAESVNDRDNDTKIKFIKVKINKIGEVSADLRPDGMTFKNPVWLKLSYKGADLTGIDENTLVIMYLNEEIGAWEVVEGSVVDTQHQTVSAPLYHFSRYAVGSDE